MARTTIRHYFLLSALFTIALSLGMAIRTHVMELAGLSMSDIQLVAFVFFATMFVVDIPTGGLADIFGRRWLTVISCLLSGSSIFGFAVARTTLDFCLISVLSGLGAACGSGAFQAWFIDQLNHHQYTGCFKRLFAWENQLNRIINIVASLVGTSLADHYPSFPWLGGGFILLGCAIMAPWLMREDYRPPTTSKFGLRHFKAKVVAGAHCAATNPSVRFILSLALIQCCGLAAPDQQWIKVFQPILPNNAAYGRIWVIMMTSAIIGTAWASPLSRWIGEKPTLIITQVLIGLPLMATILVHRQYLALSVYLIHEMTRGAWYPVKASYLAEVVKQEERATVGSYESTLATIGMMIGLTLGSLLVRQGSMTSSWLVSGGIIVLGTLVIAYRHRQR